MLKLLQLNVCLNYSTGKIAQSIGEVAMQHGWVSYIAYSSREPFVPCKSEVIRVGNMITPYIHYIENRIFDREGLSSRCATKILVEFIKKFKPDIIQLHNIHDHWVNYKILFEYLNQTDIKVVWTFHDCWAFTGHCFHFVTKNCERWQIQCYDCPLVHEYPNTLADHSLKNYELKKRLFGDCKNLTIVPCSDWMENFVKKSFLKNKKIYVIKNGVNLNTFRPLCDNIKRTDKDRIFRILAVSNIWNKEKGFSDIIKLRKILLKDDFDITVVGLNKNQLDNLPNGIVGIRRTSNVQELVELYSNADVLINPTYADTFPTVNLEALACGTPIITYRTGGSPETVDEKTGIVVNQGDVDGMAEAIKKIKNHPLSAEDCRERAVQYFDKDKCFERYISLYKQLIAK